jgi:hypothetical protein
MIEELERSVELRRRVVEHLPDYVSMIDRERRHAANSASRTNPQHLMLQAQESLASTCSHRVAARVVGHVGGDMLNRM